MRILIKRLTSKTPSFFKAVRNICVACAITASAGMQIEEKLPGPVIASFPFMLTAGLVGTFISQLTVKHPENL